MFLPKNSKCQPVSKFWHFHVFIVCWRWEFSNPSWFCPRIILYLTDLILNRIIQEDFTFYTIGTSWLFILWNPDINSDINVYINSDINLDIAEHSSWLSSLRRASASWQHMCLPQRRCKPGTNVYEIKQIFTRIASLE